jgi:hypothetical protein
LDDWALVLVFGGEAFLNGDLLLALVEVVGADLALDGEADLALFAGDRLFSESEAARLIGDFFAIFLICGATRMSVPHRRHKISVATYLAHPPH